MDFVWNAKKDLSNQKKHGISFLEGSIAFSDEYAITQSSPANNEERFLLIGINPIIGVLVVVFCERKPDLIRIISARRASRKERNIYEKRI